MPHIVTQTSLLKLNEAVLHLGNESMVMPVNFGSLSSYQASGFRIGIRYCIPGNTTLRDVEFLVGAFKDIRYPWRSNQCVEWLGCTCCSGSSSAGIGQALLTWTKGSGANANYYSCTYGRSYSKVGSLVSPATGGYAGSACYFPSAWPAPTPSMIIWDFLRTSYTATTSTWQVLFSGNSSSTLATCSQSNFLFNMETSWAASPAYQGGVTTGSVQWVGHVHPGPGYFDAVEITWNQSAFPLMIYDVAVTTII